MKRKTDHPQSIGSQTQQVSDNQWIKPVMKNYRFECCTCGAVHSLDFEVQVGRSDSSWIIGDYDDFRMRGRLVYPGYRGGK